MSVTVFGAIWLTMACAACFATSIRPIATLTLVSMVLQCTNVIVLGEIGVGPQLVTSAVFIIKSLLYIRIDSVIKLNPAKAFFVLLMLVILTSTYANGVLDSAKSLYIVQLGIYGICFARFYSMRGQLGQQWLAKTFRYVIGLVLVMGIVQIAMTSGIVPKVGVVETLFYNDPSTDVYFHFEGYCRLCSTFMEPSYCAAFLIGSFYAILAIGKRTRVDNVMLGFLLLEIILTQSTTAYVIFVVMGFTCPFFGMGSRVLKLAVPVMVIIGIVMIVAPSYFNATIFEKAVSGSALTRNLWNEGAWEAFVSSPMLGCGYKTNRASSLLLSILADTGIVGFLMYCGLITSVVLPAFWTTRTESQRASIVFVAAVVLCQFASCPDVDFCVFWFSLYLLACVTPLDAIQVVDCRYHDEHRKASADGVR